MIAAFFLSFIFAQSPAPAVQAAPKFKISLEAAPPVWLEGDALRVYLHIENLDLEPATVPREWMNGECLRLRETRVADQPVVKAYHPKATKNDGEYRIPGHARLSLQLALDNIEAPPGDAFDLFFISEKPAAGSETLRIERVENLRGARAVVETSKGNVVLELAPEAAPLASRNFVKLSESGFYDGQAFHRIAKGLCIQAGDPESKEADIKKISAAGGATFDRRPLPLERTRVAFEKGTVGLARRHDELYQQVRSALANVYKVDTDAELDAKLKSFWPSALLLQEGIQALTSGTSQFFICTNNAPQFMGRYSAFAKVVEGMSVVEAIESSETVGAAAATPEFAERPVDPVRITKIKIIRKNATAAPNAATK